MTYRSPAPEVEPDPTLPDRVWNAMNATLASVNISPLSHYQDHVQSRWFINLGRALNGSWDFIWANQSWGERHNLLRIGWLKFFWRTRKMSWATKFRWIADRLEARRGS